MRPGEILGLATDHIDFAKAMIPIRRQVKIILGRLLFAEPKGRKTREVPLPASVAERLRERMMTFPQWPAAAKTGIPQERRNGMHALRHFYASALLDAEESIKALSLYLGQADPDSPSAPTRI
jgi:integrase